MTKLTEKEQQKAIELYKQGRSVNSIEKELELNRDLARRFLLKQGFEMRSLQYYAQGDKNYFWQGGKHIDKRGYILVYAPDHPYRGKRNNKVRKHRIVMEKHLGRYLDPKEVVDHKNGDVQDNRLSNLRLFANNAEHLAATLKGKVPNWSEDGRERTRKGVQRYQRERSAQCFHKNWSRVLELLHKSHHSRSDVQELQKLRRNLRNGYQRKMRDKKLAELPLEQLQVLLPHSYSKHKKK